MMRGFWMAIVLLAALAVPAMAVQFPHNEHLQYVDNDCSVCHVADAKDIRPSTEVCLNCHEQKMIDGVTFEGLRTHGPTWSLTHRQAAKSRAYDCSACHKQEFCLECHKAGFADEQGHFGNSLTNVHRSDFQVSHPIAARTDPQLCTSCHENKFCVDCHNSFRRQDLAGVSHRRSWSDLATGPNLLTHENFSTDSCQTCHPDSVLPTHDWSAGHAREARKNLATCASCHPEGDVCLKCHSAVSGLRVNPHPKDWGDIDNRLQKASGDRTCRKCH